MQPILWLLPDSPKNSYGGLGVHIAEVSPLLTTKVVAIGVPACEGYTENNFEYIPADFIAQTRHRGDQVLLNQAAYVMAAMQRFPDTKPRAIHAFDWSTFGAAVLLQKMWDIPLVSSIHLSEHLLQKDIFTAIKKPIPFLSCEDIEKTALFRSDFIFQVTEKYAARYPEHVKKTVINHNGIDTQKFAPFFNPERKINPKRREIVFIGRFDLQKGVDAIADCKIPENCHLTVIGSGRAGLPPLETYWKKAVKKRKERKRVTFLGEVWGARKYELLAKADAVLIPSRHEPFGIVALEALAVGAVPICSMVDGLGEVLQDSISINCGETIESIQEAINQVSQPEFVAMHESAMEVNPKLAAQFTWEKCARIYDQAYESYLPSEGKMRLISDKEYQITKI